MTTPPDTKLLRELAHGRVEWQVMTRDETALVLACDFKHEAQRWVDEQTPELIARTGYHVVRQVVTDRRDKAILALCDAHDRLMWEVERLRADAEQYRCALSATKEQP